MTCCRVTCRDPAERRSRWRARSPAADPARGRCWTPAWTPPPFGDEAAWTYPPASGQIAAGWLHGRGSADSKAGAAIFAHVAAPHAGQRAGGGQPGAAVRCGRAGLLGPASSQPFDELSARRDRVVCGSKGNRPGWQSGGRSRRSCVRAGIARCRLPCPVARGGSCGTPTRSRACPGFAASSRSGLMSGKVMPVVKQPALRR
jgi:Peptidase family M20/M25/M40